MFEFIKKCSVIIIGSLFVISYWFFDVLSFHHGAVRKEMLTPDRHDQLMRWETLVVVLLFSFVAQYLVNSRTRSEERAKYALKEVQQVFQTAANGMWIIDNDFNVLRANGTLLSMIGLPENAVVGKKCYETFWGQGCHTPNCPLVRINEGEQKFVEELVKSSHAFPSRDCIVTATPFIGLDGDVIGIVEDFHDFTLRKKAENENVQLIKDLHAALAEVKTLGGLLPICAWCKNIRDDKGYWNKVESYISKHSSAQFTHSICDECMKKHHPECMLESD